jgi:hypothetical protein
VERSLNRANLGRLSENELRSVIESVYASSELKKLARKELSNRTDKKRPRRQGFVRKKVKHIHDEE